jgi:hypothetical protein
VEPNVFYNIETLENIKINQVDYQEGKGRAKSFLSKLSQALINGLIIDNNSWDALNSSITHIQTRVESYRFYSFLSKIPFTNARSISKLIQKVKEQINVLNLAKEKKLDEKNGEQDKVSSEEKIEEKPAGATPNVDPNIKIKNYFDDKKDAFAISDKLMGLLEKAYNNSENKSSSTSLFSRTVLYYALADEEKGRIGSTSTTFWESRDDFLLPFFVEYNKEINQVRVVTPTEKEYVSLNLFQKFGFGYTGKLTTHFNGIIESLRKF